MSKKKKYGGIIMPKFTLPDAISPEESEKAQIQTQHIPLPSVQPPQMLPPLIQTPLVPIARPPVPFINAIESMITIHNPISPVPEFLDIEDDDALILETVSMNTVKKVGAMKKIGTFFSGLFLLFASILFLCALATLFIIIPNLTYKSGFSIAFVVSCSYIISTQMKRFDRARQRRILTTAQLAKKRASSESDDMVKHMKVIKEDTMTYLRAINNKDYRKKSHR